jgi:hypothetical protein
MEEGRICGESPMQWNATCAIALCGLSVLFAPNSANAEWVKLEPPDAGFSVFLPATPTMQTKQEPSQVVNRIWIARAGTILCLMGVTDYYAPFDKEVELDLDMKNFLKAIEGTATSQEKVSFRDAPDGPLPALRFGFSKTGWTGRSLVVLAGDRVYNAVAMSSADADAKDLARCLAFKVTAKSPHWQTH